MKGKSTETIGRQDSVAKKIAQILGLTGLVLAGQEAVGISTDVASSQLTRQNRADVIQLLDAKSTTPLKGDGIMIAETDPQ